MRVIDLDRCVPGSQATRRGETVGGFTFRGTSFADFVAHAEAACPREACGLGVGERRGDAVLLHAYYPVENLATDDDRFDLDPGEVVRCERLARERGWDVVAVCHSHVEAPAEPSRADEEGGWPGTDTVIAEVRAGRVVAVRVFRTRAE